MTNKTTDANVEAVAEPAAKKKATSKKKTAKKTTANKDLDKALRQEEALHFFTRNRLVNGVPIEKIKEEWTEVSEEVGDDEAAMEALYKREKLQLLVVATRQSLNYSRDGINNAIERICSPFTD